MFSVNDICKDANEAVSKLNKVFDAAWELNNSGNGTDLSRMVTDSTPTILQMLGYFMTRIEDVALGEFFRDCTNVHERWNKLTYSQRTDVTQKALCEICVPFQEKYGLSKEKAMQVAKNELSRFEFFSLWDEVKNKEEKS